ncbi:PAS domain S-box protein [Hymenobacter yonginensis]|uniref:histidine kinase n=1 Tax=Hymenobacter yonginensis TaxID=748197 RepID=A0ABY7PRE6_9BACT|nr:PAS domain S-box protein [Hymenobacter yonginensis]WBO85403.1 PAS domain S-box protein [Hymenobacter yonginensis]
MITPILNIFASPAPKKPASRVLRQQRLRATVQQQQQQILALQARLAAAPARPSDLQALVEGVPGALCEWVQHLDGTCQTVYLSPVLSYLFGVPCTDVCSLTGFVHPKDRLRLMHSLETATRHRTSWQFEGRVLLAGQSMRWWRGTAEVTEASALGVRFRAILQDVTGIVENQKGLVESEKRWQAARDGVGNDTWQYNWQTHEHSLSPRYQALLGYNRRPIHLDQPPASWLCYDNVLPEQQQEAHKAVMAYLNGEVAIYSATYRVLDSYGEARWILSRGMITQRDAQGNPLLVSGTHTDVTEITKAKLELEASSLRLSSTIASMQRAVLLEDENERVILVNQAFCDMFALAYTPEQLVGSDCSWLVEQIGPKFLNQEVFIGAIRHTRRELLSDNAVVKLEDGRTLERHATPIYANGNYIGFLWKYEDITKRKKDEALLRRREEKYRSILENLNLGLLEIDLDGKVMFANESYCQISGYTKEETLNRRLDHLLVKDASKRLMQENHRPHTAGLTDTYELPIKTKLGELKWLLVGRSPLFDKDKQMIGSIGVHLDITHQKQMEAKLREAKKHAEESTRAKEIFLANMSHEIRTPMNAILGMSQLLNKTSLSGQQHNYLHAISTSAENLLVIINDILDLSKIDAGKMAIERIGFSLRRVCEQVEKTLRYKAEDKGLSLLIEVSPDVPDVLIGDPYRITQVLLNLAGNSIKFTEKGHVVVSCELAGTVDHATIVEFCVRDTGIGIDPAYLKRLFENFSQEDSSVSRKFGGTGLGLSISRSLVHLMGGEIQIQSEKFQGTVSNFTLVLPTGSVSDLPRQELTLGSMFIREGMRGKRVLLVEDNEYNRVLAKSFLRQAHIEVIEAENGAVAVDLARRQQFDLVLMDVQMPIMNGYEATSQLRKELGLTIPIIALTANAIRGDNQACLTAGMDDYLSKPFHEDELLKMVHEWLLSPPNTDAANSLYRTDLLRQAAHNDANFVTFMLRTFVSSSTDVLQALHAGLAAHDLPALRGAAHKIKPSLRHLQIKQVLALMEQLENWDGPFDEPVLAALIGKADKLLRQVTAQILANLQAQGSEEPA